MPVIKSGKLAVLPDEEINREVMDLILKESATEHAYEAFIARLISASMSYNSALFNETYERALLRFGLQTSYTNIIHPTLVRIGLLWSVNEIIPAQEHFASNLIRMKLFNAMNQLPDGDIKNTWVLFMPEHDSHEIGLLFAALMMRMSGKRVIYLGQQVPLENVIETVEQTRASGLLYFQVTTTAQQITQEIISSLEKKLNRVQRIVCASSSVLTDINCNKQTLKLSSAEEFIRWVTASKKSK